MHRKESCQAGDLTRHIAQYVLWRISTVCHMRKCLNLLALWRISTCRHRIRGFSRHKRPYCAVIITCSGRHAASNSTPQEVDQKGSEVHGISPCWANTLESKSSWPRRQEAGPK